MDARSEMKSSATNGKTSVKIWVPLKLASPLRMEGKPRPWNGTMAFVATSTSEQAAATSLAKKEAIWIELGEWIEREERKKCCGYGWKLIAHDVMDDEIIKC